MDRVGLAQNFDVPRLEEYVIQEFVAGKNDAEKLCTEYFEKLIETIENNEFKVYRILIEILNLKKEVSLVNSNFGHVIREAIEFTTHSSVNPRHEAEEVENLAKYILDYYDFKKLPQWEISFRLKNLRENSRNYYLFNNILLKIKILFDYLNELQKFDDYIWEWNNFEDGLYKIFNKNLIDRKEFESDFVLKMELLENKKNFEISQLRNRLDDADREIVRLNNQHEFFLAFSGKYYNPSPVILNNTFFGDNTPFLFNLFNFLKKNNLYNYSWSYFHSCMEIDNQEMILLNKPKKSNFIGRIFYHLGNYLVLHYKDSPMQFIKAKFLIDETIISYSFKNNHMKPNYDKFDDPELQVVDDFFENQKKIYLKS